MRFHVRFSPFFCKGRVFLSTSHAVLVVSTTGRSDFSYFDLDPGTSKGPILIRPKPSRVPAYPPEMCGVWHVALAHQDKAGRTTLFSISDQPGSGGSRYRNRKKRVNSSILPSDYPACALTFPCYHPQPRTQTCQNGCYQLNRSAMGKRRIGMVADTPIGYIHKAMLVLFRGPPERGAS